MRARIAWGFLWGVIATVAMTLVHLGIWAVEGRLTVHAMATQMMPAMIISKMFGTGLPVGTHLLLAATIHLGYGGFWGAMLFALTDKVTLWKGLAMGAFLYLGSHIFLSSLLRSGAAAAPPRAMFASLFSWFSIVTHFTYGASLGLLGARSDRAAEHPKSVTSELPSALVEPAVSRR